VGPLEESAEQVAHDIGAKMEEQSMNLNLWSRRDFSVRVGSLLPGLGIAALGSTITGMSAEAPGKSGPGAIAGSDEISRTAEAIHQEVVFKASQKRIYEALTDGEQFTKVMRLSKYPGGPAAVISKEVGGAFSTFGGLIMGRHIELVPNERIVQAWRAGDWEAGKYSIARFELKEQGAQTKIVFDHTSFPAGDAEHLLEGWNSNYWEPLRKYLA
jgi:activator of HSP90 ATPase